MEEKKNDGKKRIYKKQNTAFSIFKLHPKKILLYIGTVHATSLNSKQKLHLFMDFQTKFNEFTNILIKNFSLNDKIALR